MKKKILLYGNCHLSVIGKWLHENYSEKFDVIDSKDCGINYFYSSKAFCVQHRDNIPRQKYFYKQILKKAEEADIFLFQDVTSSIDELKSEYLYTNYFLKKISIRLPNPRFLAYPICDRSIGEYSKTISDLDHLSQEQVFNLLDKKNKEEVWTIINSVFERCMKENTNRNKFNFEIYKNNIDMNKFIEEKWKEKLLFAQWNHPSGDYFFELIKNLFVHLEEKLDNLKLKNITYPTRYSFFDEKTVLFFRKYLPKVNLSECSVLLVK
jgi:hypothetical protein